MENLQLIALVSQILTSIVAITAIVSLLKKYLQKPLIIKNIDVYRHDNDCTYILNLKSRAQFPIEIRTIRCFKGINYFVEKKKGCRPQLQKHQNWNNVYFESDKSITIQAGGDISKEIDGIDFKGNLLSNLVLYIDSSHGEYQLYYSKKIKPLEINKPQFSQIEFRNWYVLKTKAFKIFFSLELTYWIDFISNKHPKFKLLYQKLLKIFYR
jgi:hypothetical protein